MRIALLTTDNREHHRKYELAQPYFGLAIEADLQGLVELPDLEIHVISCTQQLMPAPVKSLSSRKKERPWLEHCRIKIDRVRYARN